MSEFIWGVPIAILLVLVILWVLKAAARKKGSAADASLGAPVRYTSHARQRMQERGVAQADLELVLRRPHRSLQDPVENSVRLERHFGDKLLKVWVAQPWPDPRETVVKSTAWQYAHTFKIPRSKIGRVMGKGGRTIRSVTAESNASVRIDPDGRVRISGGSHADVEHARMLVKRRASGL